jgi:hypothetical protein
MRSFEEVMYMNKEELLEFIKRNSQGLEFIDGKCTGGHFADGYFTGGIDEEKVKYIETELKVKLPISYKWFLQTFGMGGIYGVGILGFGKSSPPSVVTQTQRYHNSFRLPSEYVVIEDCDEFAYCLATDKMKDNECQVISWDRIDGFDSEEASNFIEFLAVRLSDAKDDSDSLKDS